MTNNSEMTFSQLRSKELVSAIDGKRLGRVCDLVFDPASGKIKGIIAPYSKKNWCGKGQDIFIPWKCIVKMGEDVVLVDLNCYGKDDGGKKPEKAPPCDCVICPPPTDGRPDCDMKCEKCMLFDCVHRWKGA